MNPFNKIKPLTDEDILDLELGDKEHIMWRLHKMHYEKIKKLEERIEYLEKCMMRIGQQRPGLIS
jgi:hypothetical protein